MKCFNHPKEDAIAVCKSCGKGVCKECAVILAGDSYCKTCVETGRVKVPAIQVPTPARGVPTPLGIPSRSPFIVGGVGAIICGVAAFFSLLGGFGNVLSEEFGFRAPLSLIGGIILGVGVILAGIGYAGIKRNYGVGTGTAGFAFSIVVCVFMFINVAMSIIGIPYTDSWYYDPRYFFYILSALITVILFGVMQILWGVAHINSRNYTGTSGLAMATGIMLIISGALTVSVIIAFVGIVLFFVSEILALLVFLVSKIPQRTTQTT